jgi:drug/metabolite transporter (DMT)-like permease
VFAAVLTTFFFSLSVVFARRVVHWIGSGNAFLARQVVATGVLAVYAHAWGAGVDGPGFWYFVLGGVVGFGLGDVALYRALPRIGSRLTILICQCVAAPIAAGVEWLWLGTALTLSQMIGGAVILAGVVIAVGKRQNGRLAGSAALWGLFWAFVAAFGQGYGAVLSRKAYALAESAGIWVDGGTAAYQRLLGGLVFGLVFHFLSMASPNPSDAAADPGHLTPSTAKRWRAAAPWILLNSLSGAVLGVSCYQWALATAPTGVVLPIVATTPLVVIPFAWWMEGDRADSRAWTGALIAVAGACLLALSQS